MIIPSEYSFNGITLKAKNPDLRIIDFLRKNNFEVQVENGNLKIQSMLNPPHIINLELSQAFLQEIEAEDKDLIFAILNTEFSGVNGWKFSSDKIFWLRLTNENISKIWDLIELNSLAKYSVKQRIRNSTDWCIQFPINNGMCLFDFLTTLRAIFQKPANNESKKKGQGENTYQNLLPTLKVPPSNIPEPKGSDDQFASNINLINIETFFWFTSAKIEEIIFKRLYSVEKNNEEEVEERQKLLISTLYDTILSGAYNRESIPSANNLLFSYDLSEYLVASIKCCVDIVNNKNLTPENTIYAGIMKLFATPNRSSAKFDYNDFREIFINKLKEELKRYRLSEEELVQDIETKLRTSPDNCSMM